MQAVFQDKDVIGSDDEGVPGLVFVHYLCYIPCSIIAFLLHYGTSQINYQSASLIFFSGAVHYLLYVFIRYFRLLS